MDCLLTEGFGQTGGSQYYSACPSSEFTRPAANDDHEALDLFGLPEIDFGDLLNSFTDPPELQTNLPALENVGPINLDETSLRDDLLPHPHFNAQMAISETQREVSELRWRIHHLENRLKVHDYLLPQMQHELKQNQSGIARVDDKTAKFTSWASDFKAVVEQIAIKLRQEIERRT